MAAAAPRKSLLIPGIVALAGFIVLLGLGTWQIERKAWKENLIEKLTSRLGSAPGDLPPPDYWPLLGPENAEFNRVRLNVSFPKSTDALVYTSGSALRDDVKGTGYFVFSLAKLANGPSVVVNRGFTADRNYPHPEGTQEIVGALRWPESPSPFVPERDSAGTWFARDHQAMARALGWGDVAEFYIEQEAPVPPGGVPHPSALKVRLRNDHLQYAITWYSLAGVLAVVFAIWARRQRTAAAADHGSGAGAV
ncbi:MAG: SURF1 family protein [Xanthobacteraceae bacterium]|nr:SURF1 family protein [Xanthobacteraceae bacterium]